MKAMNRLGLFATVCALILIPAYSADGAPKKKKKKAGSLLKAVLETHRLCRNLDADDEAAKSMIDQAETLTGRFSMRLKLKRVEPNEDGAYYLEGIFVAKHPKRNRYRTRDEREQIEAVNLANANLERAYQLKLSGLRGLSGIRERRLREDYEKDYERSKKQQALLLRDLVESIDRDSELRRKASEDILVGVTIPETIGRKIDIKRLMKRHFVNLVVVVDGYALGREHRAVGSAVRISSLEATVKRTPKTLRKKKKAEDSKIAATEAPKPRPTARASPPPKRSANEDQQAGRCTATTKKGSRCKRRARSSGKCWQHEG